MSRILTRTRNAIRHPIIRAIVKRKLKKRVRELSRQASRAEIELENTRAMIARGKEFLAVTRRPLGRRRKRLAVDIGGIFADTISDMQADLIRLNARLERKRRQFGRVGFLGRKKRPK